MMTMENFSEKIWKYMDLTKFISLLSKESLYFACPREFNDPFEGYFPKSYAQDYAGKYIKFIEYSTSERDKFAGASLNPKDRQFVDAKIRKLDAAINGINTSLVMEIEENIFQSGVSCWHKSEHESEAMWKLYTASGQGIAIESTIRQLRNSIINEKSLKIESITYLPEDVPKEEYGKHDPLFLKRKSFEHEKELRASIKLKEKGKGTFVKCDLDKLISRIHVSPLVEPYFTEIVKEICAGKEREDISNLVHRSTLLDKPDYTVTALARR
ncbi:MAG: hypothetical protein ACXWTL_08640 [Methylobacter sp.]